MSAPRVLIVDDDPSLRRYLRTQLRRVLPSARILVAASPEEALRVIETSLVDAVISDQHMPGGDGRALLARVAELSPPTIRILFTASVDDHEAIAPGSIHAVLQKPGAQDEVVNALLALLGERAKDAAPAGPRAARVEPERGRPADGTRPRILIIDDVPEVADVLEGIAHRAAPDLDVVKAQPSEARGLLERERYDVVLADYRMPQISGVLVLALARALRPTARRILATGYNELHEPPEALAAADVDAYVHKPPSVLDLVELFQRALSEDPGAMDADREQARILERQAIRDQGPLRLDDA